MKKIFFAAAVFSIAAGGLFADDWSLKTINGIPRITRNGEVESNFIFCGARITKGRQYEIDSVTSEVRLARATGVKIYSFAVRPLWKGMDDKAGIEAVDFVCDKILENDPDAFLWPRVSLQTGYPEMEMNEMNLSADGSRDQPSIASRKYKADCARALRDLVRYMEKKYGKHMAGYHVAGAHHGEFQHNNFSRRGNLLGYDEGMRTGFREFLRKKYNGNVNALRKKWNVGSGVTFENALVPPPFMRVGTPDRMFHNPKTEWPSIDFNEYLNDVMAQFIIDMAKVVRKECGKKRLIGVFYGYLFECYNQANGPSESGHYGLAKLINSPDIDMFCGPYSYSNQARVPGGSQFTHTVAESIIAAGKIWCNEDDTATHISMKQRIAEDGSHRAAFDRTFEEVKKLVLRNRIFDIARNYGVWWFDHHARGMWNDPKLWEIKSFTDKIAADTQADPEPYSPDVILSFDEKNAYFILSTNPQKWTLEGGANVMRDRVNRSGCTAGTWFLNDIVAGKEKQSKLDVHCNAIALSAAERKALKERASRIATVWMWAPGYIDTDTGTYSLDTIEEVSGFKVRPVNPATWCVWARPEGLDFTMPDHWGWGRTFSPVFAPIPEKGDLVLAYWRDLWGTPAIVLRPGKNGKPFSVFCGTVDIPAAVIRALADKAGAKVYCSRDAAIHKGRNFVAISGNEKGVYNLNVGGNEEWFHAETGKSLGHGPELLLHLTKGETVIACKKQLMDKLR
ncbi:MAG: hypothetical protein IJW17_10300 [Lentisphaeria bacterium]|nr:hypothetical protein [Lentisphaeria bacterium]